MSNESASPAVLAPVDVEAVDRFRMTVAHASGGAISYPHAEDDPNGTWVKFADFARLAADLAAARGEVALIRNLADRERLNLLIEANTLRQRAEAAEADAGWLPIGSAPNDERVVMAYFGPDIGLNGFASVGYFFKWESMPDRLPTGWPSRTPPTHWRPLPAPIAIDAALQESRNG